MERKLFYVNLKSFLKELVIVFPESDDELQIITTSINLAIVDDEDNEIIDTFYKTLSPVSVEIETRDLSIFDKVKWDILNAGPPATLDTVKEYYKLFQYSKIDGDVVSLFNFYNTIPKVDDMVYVVWACCQCTIHAYVHNICWQTTSQLA
jgi:hypothetical protein